MLHTESITNHTESAQRKAFCLAICDQHREFPQCSVRWGKKRKIQFTPPLPTPTLAPPRASLFGWRELARARYLATPRSSTRSRLRAARGALWHVVHSSKLAMAGLPDALDAVGSSNTLVDDLDWSEWPSVRGAPGEVPFEPRRRGLRAILY